MGQTCTQSSVTTDSRPEIIAARCVVGMPPSIGAEPNLTAVSQSQSPTGEAGWTPPAASELPPEETAAVLDSSTAAVSPSLEQPESPIPKAPAAPQEGNDVIIFDWDDTLMYTSFLFEFGRRQFSQVPLDTQRYLFKIECAAYKLLNLALGHGQTFIITNAKQGWVETCVRQYMPSLRPILEKVPVICARNSREACDVSDWKKLAFLELGRDLGLQNLRNLVSVGDNIWEIEAAQLLGKQFTQALVKTVKLQAHPTPKELMEELTLLTAQFTNVLEMAFSLNIDVQGQALDQI